MKFNVENCDVIMENGFLRLVYHTDMMAVPLVLAACESYHDLNEKAMKIIGKNEWVEDVVEWSICDASPVWHNLLADIYKNHHDLYEAIVGDKNEDKDEEDGDCYLTLTVTGDVDKETGHRLARFSEADLNEMDTDDLMSLAKELGLYKPYMMRHEVIEALANEDVDIDDCGHDEIEYDCDGCECAEKTPAGNVIYHSDEDECNCNGECDSCGCAGCDGDYRSDSEACGADEHPELPHPIKEEQPDAQQYEYVNGPDHYNGTQCIEQMRHLYGDEAVKWFCICNAYKYRFRNGHKPGVSAEQDEQKARWYEDYASNMMSAQHYY